jgi:hypothetical protein
MPESYITIDGQSTSLSWNKAPIWDLGPDFYYRRTAAGLLMWGALSDERTDLSFTISAGPRQRSHYRLPVPWVSRPYFTVSDSRLPFSPPRTTRRVAGHRTRGPGPDHRRQKTPREAVGPERGPPSPMITNEQPPEWKTGGSGSVYIYLYIL